MARALKACPQYVLWRCASGHGIAEMPTAASCGVQRSPQ